MIERFARPYAQAFLSTSRDLEDVEAGRAALGRFHDAMQATPRLSAMAANPAVPGPKKQQIVDSVCELLQIEGRPKRLLGMLLDNYRLAHLGDVLEVLDELLDRRRGVVNAEVRSAVALSQEERDQLQSTLREKLDSEVRLRVEVDPSLLGGFVAQVGSYRYDVSIQGQLERLSEGLAQGTGN